MITPDNRIAFIDAVSLTLQTYIWNGSIWATVGNPKTITGLSNPSATLIWKNRIALTDSSFSYLMALSFNNTDWNQLGVNSIPFGSFGNPSLAIVYPNRIGVIADGLDKLIEYDFNEEYFSIVGNQSTQTGISNPAICGMDYNKIAYIEETNHNLRMYEKIGDDWTAIGTPLNIPNGTNISITAMTTTRIAYVDDTNGEIRVYDWNETTLTWSLFAVGYTIPNSFPCIQAISETTIAFFDLNYKNLITFELSGVTFNQVGASLPIPSVAYNPCMAGFYKPFSIACINELPLDGIAVWPMSDY